ncbi:Hypothetical protein SRAE_X000119400 [Strongyloides ratti]|uniref:Uncharacterized protein n=1 Tax=Strongyloides ratti TaxID=34506 RepID=A0A090MN20_STRRB|nr:Hypothetical protein SRAE_X000119400 [Strongyloides ratti]CEF59446.1 Hypothetical protein SRAE_X000119400 [Strongyloides ratti]
MNHQTVVFVICYALLLFKFASTIPVYGKNEDGHYYLIGEDNSQPVTEDKIFEKRQILNSFMGTDGGNKRPHGYSLKGIPLRLMSNFRRIY